MGKNTRSNSAAGSQGDVDSKMADLEARFQQGLQSLRNEHQRSKSSDTDRDSDTFETKLMKFEVEIKCSIEELKGEIRDIKKRMAESERMEERRLRISNLNALIIKGLPEKNGADLIDEVCNLICDKVKVNILKADINNCFRLGKHDNKGGKCRPVVVNFICKWKRDEVFFLKRRLKGSEFVMSEFLTKSCNSLLLRARNQLGGKSVWTSRGIVTALYSNRKVLIRNEEDLLSLQGNN